jgi:hypothetical protein
MKVTYHKKKYQGGYIYTKYNYNGEWEKTDKVDLELLFNIAAVGCSDIEVTCSNCPVYLLGDTYLNPMFGISVAYSKKRARDVMKHYKIIAKGD